MNRAIPIVVIVPVFAALVVVAIGTYYQGLWSERFGKQTSEELDLFTERLDDVPMRIGDWVATEEKIDEKQLEASNCTGSRSRVYRNEVTDEVVQVLLVSGSARHVTIHTPDWCYQGAGFKMNGQPTLFRVECDKGMGVAKFSTASFVKEDPIEKKQLRIFWTFSEDGEWKAPNSPQAYFRVRPALFKIYLISEIDGEDKAPSELPSVEFARIFMPIVNQYYFPTENQETLESPKPVEEPATADKAS